MNHTHRTQTASTRNFSFGFTLIELMTTIAIMVLILSLTIANIQGTESSRNVALAQSDFVSDLHKIQTYAVDSEDYAAGVTPASSWGITTSSIYGYSVQSFDDTVNQNAETVSTTQFPKNVEFSSIQIQRPNGEGTVCPTSFSVQFTVPYGRVLTSYTGTSCVNGNAVTATQEPDDIVTAVIASSVDSVSQSVIINGISGNIVTP